jgi:hypothetical protein
MPRHLTACNACSEPVVFATVSNKEGRPPSSMPLNPNPDPDGNVAAYRDATGRLVGRMVGKGGEHLGYERLMMPHFATCGKRTEPSPAETPSNRGAKQERPGVTSLDQWRNAAAGNAKAKRKRRGKRADIRTYLGFRKNP